MTRPILILCLLLATLTAVAQERDDWEEAYQSIYLAEDESEEEREDDYELLHQLAERPINLNRATRESLEQLPFLSEQQVQDIMEYLDRYGPMRSMGELRMISSLDYQQLKLLPYFIFIGEEERQEKAFPSLRNITKYGRYTLTASTRVPLYDRKGDQNGYLGYKYRHWLKYEHSYGDYFKMGFMGAQDAGEPFFANRNRWGYDAYTYYLQLKKLGRVENLVVGKYKATAGLGLILGQSFSLGKTTLLSNRGRQTQVLRAHSSRSEADYFQGGGAMIKLSRQFNATAFVSYRPMDATLNDDGSAATLITSGYHRTENEMKKKYNTHLTSAGASLNYRNGGLQLGTNMVYTHLDKALEPNRTTLYRRHYAHGNNFTNASVSYAFTHPRFTLSGETALDGDGHIATLNIASYSPTHNFTLIALQRFYSYRYTTLHGHSFSDGSRVQNESGAYLGLTWKLKANWSLMTYADYAYSPWARYLISQSSHSWDFFAQVAYQRRRWNVEARYRGRFRQRDNSDKTMLVANNAHRGRLAATYALPSGWTLKTQADGAHTFYQGRENGYMISQQAAYTHDNFRLHLMAGYFHTDSYNTRLYVYEHQLTGNFSFPSFYGEGIRLALSAQMNIGKHLMVSAKAGYTNYFDRHSIGTGMQQIDASHLADIDLQLRYRL